MNYILILPQHPLKVLITLLLKPGYLQFHVDCSSGCHAVLKPKYILTLKSIIVSVGMQLISGCNITRLAAFNICGGVNSLLNNGFFIRDQPWLQ